MERQPYPPSGSCVAKNSQRPVSVETVQGGVPPYGVKETLVVNGKVRLSCQCLMFCELGLVCGICVSAALMTCLSLAVVLEGHDSSTAWTDLLSRALKEAQLMSLPPDIFKVCIYTIILFKSVLSIVVRKLPVAVLARSSREISQTVRIDCNPFLS